MKLSASGFNIPQGHFFGRIAMKQNNHLADGVLLVPNAGTGPFVRGLAGHGLLERSTLPSWAIAFLYVPRSLTIWVCLCLQTSENTGFYLS